MSEPISALNHASFDGIAKVEECGLQGMITHFQQIGGFLNKYLYQFIIVIRLCRLIHHGQGINKLI